MFNQGFDFVTEIPRTNVVKKTVQRIKRRKRNVPLDPSASHDTVGSEEIMKMSSRSNITVADGEDNGERLLVFYTGKARKIIESSKTFFMDSTFKRCSKQFK